jgi:peptide/nickel transport system ATP-binding protein
MTIGLNMNQERTVDTGEIQLEVRRLTKYFPVGGITSRKTLKALENVAFEVRRGRVLSLVGESGSGKTTTARLIARLMPPTRGEIFYKGQDVLKTEPRHASLNYRAHVQMIFQDPFSSLNPTRTVGYHLSRPLQIHKKAHNKNEVDEIVEDLLNTVGLTPAREIAIQYPHQLSGGQRQRVAIARALAVDPEIILADEPISMLDVSIRMGILNLMERLKDERGIGYLYITHDLASARYFSNQIIVLYAGHSVEGANSQELIESPAHPYTQLLLSAVPNPHSGITDRRIETQGEIISLIDPPPGCLFANRCPKAMDICKQVMPGRVSINPDHWVYCHLYGSGEL